jgi:hypothetical protein
MGDINLSVKEVDRYFSKEKTLALASLKKKLKGSPMNLKSVKYSVNYGEKIQCESLADSLSNLSEFKSKERPKFDPAVYSFISFKVNFGTKNGITYFTNDISKPQTTLLTKKLNTQYDKQLKDDLKEEKRVNALSPKERENEISELLTQLRGPGFMEIKISHR